MENFAVGDKVKITEYYLTNYLSWGESFKDKLATIVSVKHEKVYAASLSKEGKSLYQAKYGLKNEYDLYEMLIDLDGKLYIVSQLSFDKS